MWRLSWARIIITQTCYGFLCFETFLNPRCSETADVRWECSLPIDQRDRAQVFWAQVSASRIFSSEILYLPSDSHNFFQQWKRRMHRPSSLRVGWNLDSTERPHSFVEHQQQPVISCSKITPCSNHNTRTARFMKILLHLEPANRYVFLKVWK